MIALDTEDNSLGDAKILNFFDGSTHWTFAAPDIVNDDRVIGHHFEQGENFRERALHYLAAVGQESCWACNLEYDLINLFGDWLGKIVTLTYVKAGILKGSFKPVKDAPGVTFFDTLRHWAYSVADMGSKLGIPKLESDFRSVRYCRRDTEIVWRFVDVMLRKYAANNLPTDKATLPAVALEYLKQLYPVPKFPMSKTILDWFRHGYYGGRVEVYRMGLVSGRIYAYDFNSLFPSVMKDCQYPDFGSWSITSDPDFSQEGMVECAIEVPETYFPALPHRSQTEVLYPVGKLRGVWIYPEIRQAIADGAKVLTVYEAVEFRTVCEPFFEFVDRCYTSRLQAQAAGDELESLWWKLLMNSCYGKFGQGESLVMIHDGRQFELSSLAGHVNVIWSAYVTGYARLKLLQALRSCSVCYYTDTDSLFTPDELPVSRELGALKRERTLARCEFRGNKLYALEDPGIGFPEDLHLLDGVDTGYHVKAKGVRREHAADFLRTGRAVFRKPARFRESARSLGLRPNQWYEAEKRLQHVYTKRRVLPTGETEPWDIRQYRKEVEG